MFHLLSLAALLAWAADARPAPRRPPDPDGVIFKSVVRIFTVFRKPDFYQPWQMGPQDSHSGSGCILAGGRILTNAHVVSDHVFVQVRKAGDSARYTARVEFVAHDSELAVLKVDDPAFYEGTAPLELGELPEQSDSVTVYGFPDGGDDLSVTRGVVSRVEVTPYAHTGRDQLTIQTDAAINPGNSGGPMILDGKLVGVSFQMDAQAQSVGYAVPAPVIGRFLKDVADGRYDGVPDLGIRWQALENAAFRDWLRMGKGESGVRVGLVVPGSAADGTLQAGDVLLSIDGSRISDDGTVPFRRRERVLFTHLVFMRQVGDAAGLEVLRGGRRLRLEVQLAPVAELVPGPSYGSRPRYLVYAGLVFTPLTRNYIDNWDYNEVSTSFKVYLEYGVQSPGRRERVVLAHVLPHAVNAGYHEYRGMVIDKVNGVPVGSLEDLAEAFRKPQGRFHVIETDPLTDFSGRIVLDAPEAEDASQEIVATYSLPSDRRLKLPLQLPQAR